MQSIDSSETYAYGMSEDLISEKEKIKCKNIVKQYKKRIIWMMLQNNTNKILATNS